MRSALTSLLGLGMVLSACSTSSKMEPFPKDVLSVTQQQEFDFHVSRAQANLGACKEWREKTKKLSDEIETAQSPLSSEQLKQASEALATFPGKSPEQDQLHKFFRDAGTRYGFPADYGWNWLEQMQNVSPASGCGEIQWFHFAKALIEQSPTTDRSAVRTQVLKQLDSQLSQGTHLLSVFMGLRLIGTLEEKKWIRLNSMQKRAFARIEAQALQARKESQSNNQAMDLDPELSCLAKDTRCSTDAQKKLMRLWGQQLQRELAHAQQLSLELLSVIRTSQMNQV